MIRLSSFTILSHPLPDQNTVLMNGYSGALDIIQPELAAFFRKIIKNAPRGQAFFEEDILSNETLSILLERGHLTQSAHNEEKLLVDEIGRGLHEMEKKRPYFMIVPNMDCNYRCTYCFERHLQKNLNNKSSNINYHKNNVVMTPEMVPRIFSGIENIQKNAGCNQGGMINLYGGEPLDLKNKRLLDFIFKLGADKGYWFVAISNGHHLNSFLPVIRTNTLRKVQVTIDGPRHIHDKTRIHRGGASSFDRIFENINKVLAAEGKVDIRVHVSPQNINQFEAVLGLFEKEGWTNNEAVIIYANTLYRKDDGGKVCVDLQTSDISLYLDQLVGNYNNVFTSAPAVHIAQDIAAVFEKGDRFSLKGAYCGANFGHYIFAPDENIYVCWESIGKENSKIGHYRSKDGPIFNQAMVEKWFNRSVSDIEDCLECEFALICGGGCAQYAQYNTSLSNKPYCNDFQRTFELALADEVARRWDYLQNAGIDYQSNTLIQQGGI